jgi:AraC-like DNA-binding protein
LHGARHRQVGVALGGETRSRLGFGHRGQSPDTWVGFATRKLDRRGVDSEPVLRRARVSIAEIANRLRFGESTAFHRAFRRWADAAPTEYRRRHVEEGRRQQKA